MGQASAEREGAGGPAHSEGYANLVLGALIVLYVFNFIDRQLLNLFVEPIKQELGVSDTAMGFLTGLAFALFYTLAGVPLARWADRRSRTALITLGLVVWSGMTALSGLARNYVELTLARVGVGSGEASFTPSSHSLITDYFPIERRATALATFSAGASLGNVIGFLGGGLLAGAIGWRNTFVLVGLLGLPVALVFRLIVREPPRSLSARQAEQARHDSVWSVWRYLMSRPAFVFLSISASMHGFSSYGMGGWTAVFLMRVHELSIAQTGAVLALTAGIAAIVGQILGGRLADRLGRRDVRWYMYQPAITSALSLPFLLAFLWIDQIGWAIAVYVPATLISVMWTGPTYAMTQSLAKPHMRAMASAIIVFMLNLIGMGLGPLIVGFSNDLLAPQLGVNAVRYSLMLAAVPHALAAIFNLLAARSLKRDLEAARA